MAERGLNPCVGKSKRSLTLISSESHWRLLVVFGLIEFVLRGLEVILKAEMLLIQFMHFNFVTFSVGRVIA